MGCEVSENFCGDVNGHYDWINDLYLDRNDTVISFSSDGTIRKWDYEGREVFRVKGHDDKIWRAVFNKPEEAFFTIGWDGWVKKWSFKGKLLTKKHFHNNFAMALAIDEDFVYSGDWDLKLVKAYQKDLEIEKTVELPEIPMSMIIVGDHLLVGSKEGSVFVYDKNSLKLKETLHPHKSIIWRIERFLDNSVVSFSYDETTKILGLNPKNNWEVKLSLLSLGDPLMGGGVSQGLVIGGTLMGYIVIWDGITGELLKKIKLHDKAVIVVKSKDNLLVTGGRDRKISFLKYRIPLLNENKNIEIKVIGDIKGSNITPVSSVEDDKGILTGYWEKKAFYCDKSTGEVIELSDGFSAVNDVGLSKEFGFIVTANRKLAIFDREKKNILEKIGLPDNPLLVGVFDDFLIICYRRGLVEKRMMGNFEKSFVIGRIDFKPSKIFCKKNEGIIIITGLKKGEEKEFIV